MYRPALASYGAARNSCLALGGDLAAYPSFEVQLRVERYFTKQLQLASYWWVLTSDALLCGWLPPRAFE